MHQCLGCFRHTTNSKPLFISNVPTASGGSYQFFTDIGFFDKVKSTPKLSAKNRENNAYSVLPGGLRSLLEKKQGSTSLLWVAGEEREMALMVLSTAESSLQAPKGYIEIKDDGSGMIITQPSVPFSEDTATYSCFLFPAILRL